MPKNQSIVSLTPKEREAFAAARQASSTLRKSFQEWVTVGRAAMIAHQIGDRVGANRNQKHRAFKSILIDQGLNWLAENHSTCFYVLAVMKKIDEVMEWHAGLSEREQVKFASPQTIWLRAPCFHDENYYAKKAKYTRTKAAPLTVSQFLAMPGAEAAQLLYDRSPAKCWAIYRALVELLGSGAAPKPISGWAANRAAAREREHADGAGVAPA
jgi:hypothetical protein